MIRGPQASLRPKPPLVSVVLPTFDRLVFLQQGVESLRAQTLGDWELIVVDDGSTDGTATYLTELAATDARVRALTLPHGGRIARLRNLALGQATGRYVAFLDSDDLWHPEKLQRQVETFGERQGARWCFTASIGIDESGAALPMSLQHAQPPRSGWILEPLLQQMTAMHTSSVLVERTLLEDLHGFDEAFEFGEDHDLWLRLAAVAKCAGIAEPLTLVRIHPRQTTRFSQEPLAGSLIRVYGKLAAAHPLPWVRSICRRQQALFATYAALGWYARGNRRKFLAMVALAFRYDPTGGPVWKHVAGRALRRFGRLLK